jgi:hypothetical protein
MRTARSNAAQEPTSAPPQRRGGVSLRPGCYGVGVIDAQLQSEAASAPAPGASAAQIREIAARGVEGPGGPLPHLDAVQQAFGRHDLSFVRAYTSADAGAAAAAIGARAYTLGSAVAFRGAASLHTAAHEAAHVIQQAAGVRLEGGVGAAGDRYEAHADAVADAVVRGESAEPLLDSFVAAQSGGGIGVQRALGFEFQTGWGLVRSLPKAPETPVLARSESPDPTKQEDWEDAAVEHEVGGLKSAPTRALGEITLRTSPKTPKSARDLSEYRSKTSYRTEGGYLIASPTKGRRHYKFHKGQVIKDYGGFKMTVDDASTPLGAELEWVIDPPIAESTDVQDVGELFARLLSACKALLNFKNRESFLLSEVTKQPADDSVEIQPGVKGHGPRDMEAAPQATGGVSFDRLYDFFKDLKGGKEAPSEILRKGRGAIKGGDAPARMIESLDKIPGLMEMSPRLKGLLSMIVRYVHMGANSTPLAYAKVATLFLARTDFAQMFSLLPEGEKEWLKKDPNQLFRLVQLANPGLKPTRKFFVGGIRRGKGVFKPSLTVGQWITRIAAGEDQLSGGYWKGQDTEQGRTYQRELESMGSLGTKTDKVGEQGLAPGIVIEFRGHTERLEVDKWGAYAVAIFTYLKELNHRK